MYRQSKGEGRLVLVGNGSTPYVEQLQWLARELGVSSSVEFCGWLEGSVKYRRMSEAHALLMASAREGWGLVVTECNACGTPAIVYDVPGLRDSVRNESTGLVVQPNSANLSQAMIRLISDQDLYRRLSAEAKRWSRTLSFDQSVLSISDALHASGAA
jgi:glycosyltransferase involved in cell wall biosynthesis